MVNVLQLQESALRSKPDIVVATPGRMIDHIRNSMSVHLDELAVLILDEADRLLELGFSAEIRELVLFSYFCILCMISLSFASKVLSCTNRNELHVELKISNLME